ncbi:MAG: IPT/TIG domain-containing protein [Actinomycetota bacterium]|nr:IPT/TIG domain-containing protein [Actinomycetota bacterium]
MFRKTGVILIAFLLALAGVVMLGGAEAARAGDWIREAAGGMDGTYRRRAEMAPSMAMNGSDLFVGTGGESPYGRGCSIWRYDGSAWTLAGDDGMGDPDNSIVWAMETYDTRLYAGTLNHGGCQVLRYEGGTSWTQVNESGFGEENQDAVMSMGLYGGALYAGTFSAGAEVWRYDGGAWTCAGRPGAGTWSPDNMGASSMAQYGGRLYVGFCNPSSGAEVWSYDGSEWKEEIDGGFGSGSATRDVMSMAVLADKLFVGTYDEVNGCEVWGYDGDTGWNAVPAIGRGFGNPENYGAQSMAAAEGGLVVGTYNVDKGCEVWLWDFFDTEQIADSSFDAYLDPSGPGSNQDAGAASLFLYGTDLLCGTQSVQICEVRKYAGGKDWPLVAPLGFASNQNMGVGAMAVYGGQVIAGTDGQFAGCRVWRGGDEGGWEPISTAGFGASAYNADVQSLCRYGPDLYAGVMNYSGCGVWRYNGSAWTQVNQPGFGKTTNPEALCMTVFEDSLFVGTFNVFEGAEIWRFDGGNWTQANESGFGQPAFSGIWALAAHDGKLYATYKEHVFLYDGGTDWTQTDDGSFFGDNLVTSLCSMGDFLYAGTQDPASGCKVGRYDGSEWTMAAEGGFGDKENQMAASMAVFDSRLYVGTESGANGDGGQVWSYDGESWLPASQPGFGDADNTTIKFLLAHGTDLYAGTWNEWTGCEVWRTSASDPALPPGISSISPAQGRAGDTVIIEGRYFGSARGDSRVSFGGVPASDYPSWSPGRIEARIPPGVAGNVKVGVTTTYGTSNLVDLRVVSSAWYLAEGSDAWGFSTMVAVENPNPERVSAEITYMTLEGLVSGGTFSINPESRLTVNPALVVPGKDFSTRVECLEGLDIAVERTMVWGGGIEGHSSVGVTSPATRWYLPEGCSDYGFETWTLIQNPNDVEAVCDVTYMIEGEGAVTLPKTVPAGSRISFDMAADIGAGSASIMVESDLAVIPERSMYRDGRREGHCSVGATSPALDYYLAEGSTAWGFETWVLVQNPNPEAATVTLTYMTPGGPEVMDPFAIPAKSRLSFRANDFVADKDISVRVSGSLPIVAERAMYWDSGTGQACHDSIGLPSPHREFYLPDADSRGGVETFTLVQNPNDAAVTVRVTYMTEGGNGNVSFADVVGAGSRKTYNLADRLPGARASVRVTCLTPGERIVAEKAVYWNDRGAGTGSIGGFAD